MADEYLTRQQGQADSWFQQLFHSAGIRTDPADGTLLAQLLSMDAGWYDIYVNMFGNADHLYLVLRHWNVGLSAVKFEWGAPTSGYQTAILDVRNRYIGQGEALRVEVVLNAVGSFIGYLHATKRAD